MPEGDTIHTAARTLQRAIGGEAIERLVIGRQVVTRAEVREVYARGKNLLIAFDEGVLHTHMMMHGAWHIYRPGERWKKNRRSARVVIETASWHAVCFSPGIAKLLRHEHQSKLLRELGPDLLAETFALDEIIARVRRAEDMPIGEIVMQQTIAAGIGNVYKSEVLFITKTDPRATALSEGRVRDIYRQARTLMQQNLDGNPRRTRRRFGPRHYVYDRSGEPCFECGTAIQMFRQGDQQRSTYFCAQCQDNEFARAT